MFCSKCGKTLMPEHEQCPHCGNPVGESRFEGMPYTSAQPHILPDAPAGQAVAAYTRTTYTTMPEEAQQEGPLDSRTTYRPAYEDASAPEAVRQDMRAMIDGAENQPEEGFSPEDLSEEAINTLNAVEEELKMEDVDTSELRSRPIEATGRAGISAGVEDYIQKLDANQSRRAARRRRTYDDNEDAYVTPEEAGVYGEHRDVDPDIDVEQSEVFDDINEDEFDEIRYGRAIGVKEILKVALIMVLAAALIVGGVLWFRHIRGSQSSSKIEGVTEALYNDGVDLVKSHAGDVYINEMVNVYRAEGVVGYTSRAASDAAAIDALLPEEPQVNDSLFVSALQTIQGNIGNAILMDAASADQGLTSGEETSEARWAIVNESIAQLEAASTAQELTAILNGDRITVSSSPTPTPVPEITYPTLSKGDKNDDVLEMQNRLYVLGFLLDDRDGAFGNKTQTAVKAFQQAAGLEVTGIADNETLKLMYSNDAPRTEYAPETPTPAPTQTPEPEGGEALSESAE